MRGGGVIQASSKRRSSCSHVWVENRRLLSSPSNTRYEYKYEVEP